MALPIQLSLAGDGRFVILTPQTVRYTFFQFTKVNLEYTGRQKFPLNRPLYKPFKIWKYNSKRDGIIFRTTSVPSWAEDIPWKETEATLLDALYRAYLNREQLSYLHKKEIQYIEREINKQIVWNNLALVENEGRLLEGYGICQEIGKNREKVKYIQRHGMIFILERIMRETVLKAENLDLFLQDVEEGRRQRAEGRRNNWMGIQTPTNCKHRINGGVLNPCSLRSQAEGGASIPFCLLPPALCLS